MTRTWTDQRWGGVLGLIAALILIPAYIAGVPDASSGASYTEDARLSVIGNGLPMLVYVPLFLVFLAAVHQVFARVPAFAGWSTVPLLSGTAYVVFAVAGTVSEVAYPSAVVGHPDIPLDGDVLSVFLAFASWFYLFSQVALAVLILVCGYAALRFRVFPRWLGVVAVVAVLLILTRGVFPLAASLVTPIWIGLLAIAMITARAPVERSTAGV